MTLTDPKTILVVEDEDDLRALLRYVLAREGYRVIEAADGVGAVELSRLAAPHLVIMDLAMPGMNGLDAARLLKQDPATAAIPIVAMTASTWFSSDTGALERSDFDAALPKPFQIEVLLAELRRMLPVPA